MATRGYYSSDIGVYVCGNCHAWIKADDQCSCGYERADSHLLLVENQEISDLLFALYIEMDSFDSDLPTSSKI